MAPPATGPAGRERIGRVERERAVRAEQVRRAHPAQLARGACRTAGSRPACGRWSSRCRGRRARSQKAPPCLSSSTRPDVSGSCHRPSETKWLGGTVLVVDRYGVIVFGSRWTKSKMPWPPGSSPVMNDDQATGLWGGIEVPSAANAPRAATCAKCGSRPWAIRSRVRLKSRPSNPSTMTRRPIAWRWRRPHPLDRDQRAPRRRRQRATECAGVVIRAPRAVVHPCRPAARCRTGARPLARYR